MNKKFVDLDFCKLDIDRKRRRGFPEIIFGPSKTNQQIKKIVKEFKKHTDQVFISRLELKHYRYLKKSFKSLTYFKAAKLAFLGKVNKAKKGNVVIITAGTADIGAAQEAAVFLELTGNKVTRIYDVGVAGIHRLKHYQAKISQAKVIIAVAGMEAALASVVSGLTKMPVIALPTSVGYGASFKGIAALLSMLNSCSLGIGVVNIDNGLGAGYLANMINR